MFSILKTGLRNALMAWKRRVSIRALDHVDDRLLKDKGLHRSEITSLFESADRQLRNR